MKYNSIEGISRWYESVESWEEWEVVKERAIKEWREEMESAYKDGVHKGMENVRILIDGMEKNVVKLKGDIQTPMSSEDWFKNNWE
jgi:hypothetical protein